MIHVDTNFLIQSVLPGSRADAALRFWAAANETIGISSIAWAEFLCGPLDSLSETLARAILPNPEPFIEADAVMAAQLFNLAGRRSRSLPDCMIASVAIRLGARLATENTSDFAPFESAGLLLA